jgi:hypothetical protein
LLNLRRIISEAVNNPQRAVVAWMAIPELAYLLSRLVRDITLSQVPIRRAVVERGWCIV